MGLLNIFLGVAIGALFFIPTFFIKPKWARFSLMAFAVISAALTVQLSTLYFSPLYASWRFERDINKQPLFKTIAKYHPQEYQGYLHKVNEVIKSRGDTNLIPLYSAQLVDKVFYPHLQHAPDENVAMYLRATLDLYHYLYGKDPRMILKMENKNSAEPVDFKVLTHDKEFEALLNRLIDTKRFLIEAAIKTPIPPPTQDQAAPLLNEILDRLVSQHGEDGVRLMFAPPEITVPAQPIAKLFIELYSQILLAGKDKAGIIMRHIGNLRAQDGQKTQVPAKVEDPLPSVIQNQMPLNP